MYPEVAICINKKRDCSNNIVEYWLLALDGNQYKCTPKEVKKLISSGIMHVTNLRISKKKNIVGISDIIADRVKYFVNKVDGADDVIIWAEIGDRTTGNKKWIAVDKLAKMIEKDKTPVLGFRPDGIELFNIFTAELMNIKVGTPMTMRIASTERRFQLIYLGHRYSKEEEVTKLVFFDGTEHNGGIFEIGVDHLYNTFNDTSLEYGISDARELNRLIKALSKNKLRVDTAERALELAKVCSNWKTPSDKVWAFRK